MREGGRRERERERGGGREGGKEGERGYILNDYLVTANMVRQIN